MRTIEQKGLDKDWFTMPSYRSYMSLVIQVVPKTTLKHNGIKENPDPMVPLWVKLLYYYTSTMSE